MPELCDLQIHVNGQQTFFLNQKIVSKFSARLRKIVKQEKKKTQIKNSLIDIDDFPGGPDGFELVSRFCYNNGEITVTVSNVSLLHCCSIFLGMTEKMTTCNLLKQTEIFLEGMFYWPWNDVLVSLKSCESFFSYADSCGLLQKLVCSLLAKVAQNSDVNLIASSSSSSSSPETASGFRLSSSTKTTPESNQSIKPSSSSKSWWFDDLTILSPKIIEKLIKTLGAYGTDNNSLILTKFLLHYLKTAVHSRGGANLSSTEYGGLADTAVHGVTLMGKTAFSCRGLFWVLKVLSDVGVSRNCRSGLENLIGGLLHQATLDDLLVSGRDGAVYDVNLVVRLIRVFVNSNGVAIQRLKKVGMLIDKYLSEISPDHHLKVSKFLGVAESLPDSARDCVDGVYRAIDIYLESHPSLSFEERSRLCRCLNYQKLTLEASKDLAKNPKIPPRIAVQALASQGSHFKPAKESFHESLITVKTDSRIVLYDKSGTDGDDNLSQQNVDMRLNLQRMQWRVVELEKVCKDMKGQMSKLVKTNSNKTKAITTPQAPDRVLPRLC